MINRGLALLLACVLVGCGELPQAIEAEILAAADEPLGSSKVERVKFLDRCDGICRRFSSDLGACDRKRLLKVWAMGLRRLELDTSSYKARQNSLSDYEKIVERICGGLASSGIGDDDLWEFRLDALFRIVDEMQKCQSEPLGGPYDISEAGRFFMTQRQYLSWLRKCRFDLVRKRFETGEFALFFKELDPEKKAEWRRNLSHLAGRDVVIYDPDDPFAKMPVYIPEDDREWLPQSDPLKPREYIERMGNGKILRMKVPKGSQ